MADSTDSNERPFRRHPGRFLADVPTAANAIVAHLESTDGWFDRLSLESDPARITADDLIAVSMLGVPVPIAASAWLLSPEGQWLTTERLAAIPSGTELWSCDADSILRTADLFQLLRASTSQFPPEAEGAAVGQATATRILAAKRPAMVPIDDRQIRSILRYSKDALWFRRWRSVIDDELLASARAARELAAAEDAAAARLSELRILDIVIRRVGSKRPRHRLHP